MTLFFRPAADAINHLLASAPWATDRLSAFPGSVFRIDAEPFDVAFEIERTGLLATASADAIHDVLISVPTGQLSSALTSEGVDGLMNHVRIEGNAELAEAVGFVFRNLRWDAEEDLSRLIGDIPAHRLALTLRSIHAATLRSISQGASSLAEYLTEENRLLAHPSEVAEFGHQVVQLRDAVARLGKRIDRAASAPVRPKL